MDWRLRVTGTPAHSSQIFREEIGHGAIFEAARILNAFREKMAGEEHLTFNPGVILGGTAVDYDAAQVRGTASGKTNIIAAADDGRRRPPHAVAGAARQGDEDDARDRGGPRRRRRHATITFGEGYPPLAPTDGNAKLLAVYDRASRDLGFGPVTAVDPGQGRRRRRVVRRRRGEDDPRRRRPDGARRSHAGETADLGTLPTPDQARGDHALQIVTIRSDLRT